MNTQYRKNLKAAMQASKDYTDKKAQEILWKIGEYDITTQNDNTTALVKTAPSGATRVKIKRISGNCVKYAPSTASDDSVAKDKVIPENTYTTELNTLGGMSYKSENLIVLPNVDTYTNAYGITYKVENGIIYLNGTATATHNITLITDLTLNGTYSCSGFNDTDKSNCVINLYNGNTYVDYIYGYGNNIRTNISINNTITKILINISSGATLNNAVIKPMLVKGSTAPTTYQPYFEGIRDSAVSSVISKDSNNTALQTITIPNEIQALTGYGWGINSSVYNYIGFENKKFIQKVKKIVLNGSENWIFDSASGKNWFYTSSDSKTNSSTINCLSSDLTEVSRDDIGNIDNVICTNGVIIIRMSQFNGDITAFKEWLSNNNITLYYWLATSVETDISSYLPADFNKIATNDNYTDIEFVSEYGYDIPNKISFYGTIKETLCTAINKNDALAVSLTNNEAKYGWSVGSAYNTRDYTTNKGSQKVGRVDLGTLDYILSTSSGRTLFKTTISDIVGQINPSYAIQAICSIYNAVSTNKAWVDKDMAYTATQVGSKDITFVNNDYSSASAFKAAMSGVYLYYELAEEIPEDITPLDNNVIEVVENDELGFVNSENQAVPSEITYRIEVEK